MHMDLRAQCADMAGVTPRNELYRSKNKKYIYTAPKMEPVTYTLQDMKSMLQMSAQGVRRFISENNIPTIRDGKNKILVLRSAFDDIVQKRYGFSA